MAQQLRAVAASCFLFGVLGAPQPQFIEKYPTPGGGIFIKKTCDFGWRDGSEVKSTDCSSRGSEFNSQQPHGGSRPSVMKSGALLWCADIHKSRMSYT